MRREYKTERDLKGRKKGRVMLTPKVSAEEWAFLATTATEMKNETL